MHIHWISTIIDWWISNGYYGGYALVYVAYCMMDIPRNMQWISTYKSIEYPECYGGGYTVDTLWNILWCTSDDIHKHIHWIFTGYPLLLYGGYAMDIKVDIHWFLTGGYPHEDPLNIL